MFNTVRCVKCVQIRIFFWSVFSRIRTRNQKKLRIWTLFTQWSLSKISLSHFSGTIPSGNYMFKVNNRNSRTRYELCSNLTIKTLERRHWRRSGVFILNFEHISHLVSIVNFERQMLIKNFHDLANLQVPKYSLCIL